MRTNNRLVAHGINGRNGGAYNGICQGQPRKHYIPLARHERSMRKNFKYAQVRMPRMRQFGTCDKGGKHYVRRLQRIYARRIKKWRKRHVGQLPPRSYRECKREQTEKFVMTVQIRYSRPYPKWVNKKIRVPYATSGKG